MPMIFSHIGLRRLPRLNSEEIEIDPKASSVCLTFGCGIFFLVCAMIGYFYVKAFEMNGLSLPGLLKVCVGKNDRLKNSEVTKMIFLVLKHFQGKFNIGINRISSHRNRWKTKVERKPSNY